MSKKVENVRVKGGMKRYREQQAAQTGRALEPVYEPKPNLELPAPDWEEEAAPVRSKKLGMVAAMITIHVIAIGGLVGYQFVRKVGDPPIKPGPPPATLVKAPAPVLPPPVVRSKPAAYLGESHEVQAADTWSKIAKERGVSESQLKAANPNVADLRVGLVLTIPESQNIIAVRTEETPPAPVEITTAPKPGSGEKEFALNDGNPGYSRLMPVLRPEEQRSITPRRPQPTLAANPPPAGATPPKIEPELRRIFPKQPASIPEPPESQLAQNGEEPKQTLTPPKAKIVQEPTKAPKAKIVEEAKNRPSRQTGRAQEATGKRSNQVVKPGDTLFSISRRMGVSVDQLKSLNGLTSDTIQNGQTLEGPSR